MTHPLVTQLRFARSELVRAFDGVTEEDAQRRILPMNCLSWMVGHLANQENFYWVLLAQDEHLAPGLNDLVGYGQPASTPSLEEMWEVWEQVTSMADKFLDTLTPDLMQTLLEWRGKPRFENIGTMLLRNIYHYWFHTGEAIALRQLLGHKELPEFVGDMSRAIYSPEAGI
jgi:hypothetical protein